MDTSLALDAGTAWRTGLVKQPKFSEGHNLDRLHQTAREFEEVFLAQMLQPMLSGLTPETPFGGGPGEDVWQGMLVTEYAKAIVARGGIGLADAVVREILIAQETAAPDLERELPK